MKLAHLDFKKILFFMIVEILSIEIAFKYLIIKPFVCFANFGEFESGGTNALFLAFSGMSSLFELLHAYAAVSPN